MPPNPHAVTYVAWFTVRDGGYVLWKSGFSDPDALADAVENWLESGEAALRVRGIGGNIEIIHKPNVVKVTIKEDDR